MSVYRRLKKWTVATISYVESSIKHKNTKANDYNAENAATNTPENKVYPVMISPVNMPTYTQQEKSAEVFDTSVSTSDDWIYNNSIYSNSKSTDPEVLIRTVPEFESWETYMTKRLSVYDLLSTFQNTPTKNMEKTFAASEALKNNVINSYVGTDKTPPSLQGLFDEPKTPNKEALIKHTNPSPKPLPHRPDKEIHGNTKFQPFSKPESLLKAEQYKRKSSNKLNSRQ